MRGWIRVLMFSLMVSSVAAQTPGDTLQGERPSGAASAAATASDRYAVPAGGVDELLRFVEDVREFRPKTPQQTTEHSRRAAAALKAAATKILRLEKDKWSKAYQTALRVLLEDRIRTIKGANPAQQQQTLRYVKTFLTAKAERAIEPQDVILAMSTGWALESSGKRELAADAYRDFATLVAGSKDERLSRMVVRLLDGPARQLALLGARFAFDEEGNVRQVNLAGVAGFTDTGLVHVKRLTNLQELNLNDTRVTDAGLENLKGLTSLQSLYLNRTQVTDAGLEHLRNLTNLQRLHLVDTQVTDAGLACISSFSNLVELYLDETKVISLGLGHLKGLGSLRRLGLSGTQLNDTGLQHLEGLTSLQRLDIHNTQVTDGGLEHLKGLASLQWLDLGSTQVSDAGVDDLKKTLLRVWVGYDSFSSWMPAREYQQLFEAKRGQKYYPAEVEGKNAEGVSMFRARFVRMPNEKEFRFYTFHGINRAEYVRRTTRYRQEGLHETSRTSFVDMSGVERFSGTWEKRTGVDTTSPTLHIENPHDSGILLPS